MYGYVLYFNCSLPGIYLGCLRVFTITKTAAIMIFMYLFIYLTQIPVRNLTQNSCLGKTLDVGIIDERVCAACINGAKILFKKLVTPCVPVMMLAFFS